MSWVAVGTVVVGGVASAVSANQSKQAQKGAAARNRESAQQTNDVNKQMFDESIGADIETTYWVDPVTGRRSSTQRDGWLQTPSNFRDQWKADLTDAWNDSVIPFGEFESAAKRFQPSQRAAEDVGMSLFKQGDGSLEDRMLKNAKPVQDARLKFKRQSAVDSLNKTLASIESAQSMKGYSGDSFGTRRLRLDANRGAADAISGANLENLEENRRIQDAILSMQMGNLQMPTNLARLSGESVGAASKAYADYQNARLAPLSAVVGRGQFKYDRMPTVEPIYDSTWGDIGNTIAGAGAAYAQKKAQDNRDESWRNFAREQANKKTWDYGTPDSSWMSPAQDFNGTGMWKQ